MHELATAIKVKSTKQAYFLKSQMREASRSTSSGKPTWTQVIRDWSYQNILAEYRQSEHKSDSQLADIFKGQRIRISMRKDEQSTEVTQRSSIMDFAKPASKETILAHIMRVAPLLPQKGIGKNSSQEGIEAGYIWSEYVSRILEWGTSEVDLVIALDWFVENTTSGFFPTIAELKRKLKGVEKDD